MQRVFLFLNCLAFAFAFRSALCSRNAISLLFYFLRFCSVFFPGPLIWVCAFFVFCNFIANIGTIVVGLVLLAAQRLLLCWAISTCVDKTITAIFFSHPLCEVLEITLPAVTSLHSISAGSPALPLLNYTHDPKTLEINIRWFNFIPVNTCTTNRF